jgi:hypothetical protein
VWSENLFGAGLAVCGFFAFDFERVFDVGDFEDFSAFRVGASLFNKHL